ncbi:hypothetical protein KJ590_00870, partial [Patescibacteria group bacterium]|nr:hypothetical protein [Patescibacteria group bacterium]
MPIILKCNECGKETSQGYPADQGWSVKPQIGGTEVLCPDCRQKKAAATTTNNDALMRIFNLSNKQPADFAECGARLFFFFREEQKKHGRKGCLCAECEGDMVNALKKLMAQKETAAANGDKPVIYITRSITPVRSTLRPSEP